MDHVDNDLELNLVIGAMGYPGPPLLVVGGAYGVNKRFSASRCITLILLWIR